MKTLGTLIDELNTIRDQRRTLAEQDKLLEAQFKELEEQVKVRLAAEGMEKATGKTASVSLSRNVVATIKDWEQLTAWVKKTGNFQLFQRRISDPAFRELLELKKKDIPGLERFEKVSVNLRALSS